MFAVSSRAVTECLLWFRDKNWIQRRETCAWQKRDRSERWRWSVL